MKISQLIACIVAQYEQAPEKRRPLFAQGAPGIGKSDAPRQAARELGIGFMSLQATIEDPITLSGLPARALSASSEDWPDRVQQDFAVFLPFADKLPTSGEGILCIDEINTAPPSVQAGLYDLFLHGQLGSYRLPPGWYVMATGNRDGDNAATQRIPMPLIGRWTRVIVDADREDWTNWALVNGVRPEVIAFYAFRPELFDTFDPKVPQPYSCPRTAVFASDLLGSAPPGLEHELLRGTIGDGPAAELWAFVSMYRDMVSTDDILRHPDTATVPKQLDALYAVCGAIASVATPVNFNQVLIYAERMPKEYQVLIVKHATRRDKAITTTQACIGWCIRNQDIVAGV